jgi:hypothetical protein
MRRFVRRNEEVGVEDRSLTWVCVWCAEWRTARSSAAIVTVVMFTYVGTAVRNENYVTFLSDSVLVSELINVVGQK